MKKTILISTFQLFFWSLMGSEMAYADDIRLGVPGYGGSGCPSGSASVTLSPDQKALTLIFDSFMAEAGAYKRLGRKSCNLAIPVHIPQGFSVSIIQADYRGFVSIPEGAQGQFSSEFFFAGGRGPKAVRRFYGPFDSDYLIESGVVLAGQVWSACGADVNLRVNSSIYVTTNSYGDDALATVDSADFKAGIVYKLQWKRCQ